MRRTRLVPLSLVMAVVAGCNGAPGRPSPSGPPADQGVDFDALYARSCAACHGRHGEGGAAIALGSPAYLAIADDSTLRRVIARGVSGTPMPAFARSAGGTLNDSQVAALVAGIRRWARPGAATAPPYAAELPGDAERGSRAFQTFCGSCHGRDGKGGDKAGSVVDPAYLALVSDQYLRTVVIAGRPALDAPDWRSDVPGRPMTNREITDVVTWLVAQRARNSGPPHAAGQEAEKGDGG